MERETEMKEYEKNGKMNEKTLKEKKKEILPVYSGNRYEIKEKIGEGGMAVVYLGWDRHMERKVAIKQLKKSDAEAQEAFRAEADFMKKLHHPMIPVIYDLPEGGQLYLVMEYADGISLREYIGKNGCMEEEQACACGIRLLQCLSYLHNKVPPVIYCDLKPDNIMVCRDGSWKLVDWGAAFSMQYGGETRRMVAGTRGYAPPEQTGEDRAVCAVTDSGMQTDRHRAESRHKSTDDGNAVELDNRCDLFAFGKTLFYMVTGINPASVQGLEIPIQSYNPALSDGLEQVIKTCTAPDREERYRTAREVIQALRERKNFSVKRKRRGFIRKIEKQVRLFEEKEECTFYKDSCIL